MAIPQPAEFTALLFELRQGNKAAADEIFDLVYQELRRLARYYLRHERPNHTLQATALVHEVYLRLFGDAKIEWADRAHFFRVAGRQMRRILADYGRAARAEKRGGRRAMLSFNEAQGPDAQGPDAQVFVWHRPEDLLALEEAIGRLEQISRRASEIVELRFLCGFTEKEAAEALDISVATLKREWAFAKGFILNQLTGDSPQITLAPPRRV
jgi:RNA polymerase sigma factor (TIGR02999 family)